MKNSFNSFSKKQLTVLCWWHKNSPYRKHDAIICDGAVRSGKTTCMSLSFILWSFYEFDDTSFAICGKTVKSARRNIVKDLLPLLTDLGFVCKENIGQSCVTVSFMGKTNRFYIFGGRDEGSAALIQGMTLGGVLLDEVALMPRSFTEQAMARCSLSGAKFWFNCNPENPMHWFYKEWIEKCDEKNCLYIHFLMNDNPSLTKKVIARYESLYSGTFYERFVLGKWVAADGLVYPDAAQGKFTREIPASFSKYYVSCDYGTVNPTSMGLWGLNGGVWYRISEYYYNSRQEGRQKTDEEYYEDLLNFTDGKAVTAVIVDPSAASFIECICRHGRFNVLPAKNDVTDGIRKVQSALRDGKIVISPSCKSTMKEFSLYRWDDSAKKDVPKKENDHAMDEIRYFVMTVLSKEQDDFFALSSERKNF